MFWGRILPHQYNVETLSTNILFECIFELFSFHDENFNQRPQFLHVKAFASIQKVSFFIKYITCMHNVGLHSRYNYVLHLFLIVFHCAIVCSLTGLLEYKLS